MRKLAFSLFAATTVALGFNLSSNAIQPPAGGGQRPEGGQRPPGGERPGGARPEGGQQGGRGGQPGQPGGRGMPRFEMGKVLPPMAMDQLKLTDEQKKQIEEMEKEVKAKLEKILTEEQKKQLEQIGQRGGPGGQGGPGGRGGPGGPGGPGAEGGRPGGARPEGGERPQGRKPEGGEKKPPVDGEASAAGIQWFATWESAKAEAARLGLPILMVSAAPHCSGVTGIW